MSSNIDPSTQSIRTRWYQSPGLILTFGIVAVSSASLFIRYAQMEMPSLVVAAFRLGFASLLMTPWVVQRHSLELKKITKIDWLRIVAAGLLLAIHFAVWITSLEYTSVSSSVVLVTTTPIWVALFTPIFLKEKSGRNTILGLIIAIFGGIIVSLAGECQLSGASFVCHISPITQNSDPVLGNILALIGAICSAFYLIFGRVLRKTVDLSVYVYCIYSCAALFLVLFVIGTGNVFYPYSLTAYGFCLALAIFPQIVGHTSLNWALAYLPIGFVAIVLLGEPVGSTILAALFLREIPSILEIIGGLTILMGIFFASRKNG